MKSYLLLLFILTWASVSLLFCLFPFLKSSSCTTFTSLIFSQLKQKNKKKQIQKGGAERLVVDAGVGLQQNGHSVIMYTSHHDKSHCFKETIDGKIIVLPFYFQFFFSFLFLYTCFRKIIFLYKFLSISY